ncbi:TDT family transporter [uncultured Streptomyces sp.]|uniref:TDT family transporter n=1 Tax=uncultured Streptomyces sp. TaxID=174707 RepID=UPI00261702EE|nr:TDT family transporter [uncultured Streptomyces sp.]
MTTLLTPPIPAPHAPPGVPGARFPAVRHLGPQWYASVMGTAIVAGAGAALPVRVPGLDTFCAVVWLLSAVLLLVLLTARGAHWVHHREQARADLLNPGIAPFYGCLSMALLAVGGASMTAGAPLVGRRAALVTDAVLYSAGALTGLVVAVVVPYLMIVRHRPAPGTATPVWLLPLVAPMVAAALGPLLVAELPAGQGRGALLLACYGMFGLSLLATALVLPLVFARLVHTGPLPLALTPTLFLVLGPLGQSVTAVNALADVAPGAVGPPYASAFGAAAVLYGVPVTGFALLWLALATALVVRAAVDGMPFSMTWWGFTFPVGTCVTGASGLARHTGLDAFTWVAVALYALLLAAWAVTGARTVRGLLAGTLPAPPAPVAAAG